MKLAIRLIKILIFQCLFAHSFVQAESEAPRGLLGFSHGQYLDRLEDQSINTKKMTTYFLGFQTTDWRTLFEVYSLNKMTGNATLEVSSKQTHFDLSVSRRFSIFSHRAYYAGLIVKLFRMDTDTRVLLSARSDTSGILYSGGILFGWEVFEFRDFLLSAELRAFKHERFDPDPQPQGLLRFAIKL